jgi:hypothetical protein
MIRRFSSDTILLTVLALLMLATRPHILDQYFHMPDTAWASFFVMGYFIRARWAFPALFALGFAIDVVVIYLLGGSDFCFTPAYWMLVPAYGTMWLGGRFAARHLAPRLSSLPVFAVLISASALVAHMFSSGGFYYLSDRFAEPTLVEFWARVEKYFPGNLLAVLVWTGIAALAFGLWQMSQRGTAPARNKA